MYAPTLDLHAVNNPIVKLAIEAMNGRNKKLWHELFSDNPLFMDDGNPSDFTKWSERDLFGSYWLIWLQSTRSRMEGSRFMGGFIRINGEILIPLCDSMWKIERSPKRKCAKFKTSIS
jgi:hypothetical protein